MWSKLKEFLRSAEARSRPSLIEAIASALETITAQDVINWLASCGFRFIQKWFLVHVLGIRHGGIQARRTFQG